MAFQVGRIEAVLGARIDDDGFRKYDRLIDKARRERDVKTELRADADTRGVDRYNRALKSADDQSRRTERSTGRLRGVMKAAVFGGAVAGAYGLAKAAKFVFDEFAEGQRVAAQTESVLKSTGGVAKVTARDVEALATSISRKTGIDDEAIQSGENLLLTFTNIRNEAGKGNRIFDQATHVLADMSTALGQDTKSSAIQLGKALNDPIRGVTALQRVGVSFTKGQRDQIKALVESGRTLDAQKIILAELRKEFGGSAEAYGRTLPGAIAKARNAMGNLAETIGAKLAPFVGRAATALARFVEQIGTGTGAGGRFRTALAGIAQTVGNVARAFGPLAGTILRLVGNIGSFLGRLSQTRGGMVLLGAAVGALVGHFARLAVFWAAGKVVAFATAVARVVTAIRSAAAALVAGEVAAKGFTLALARTGIGALIVGIGAVAGALLGFNSRSREAAATARQVRDAVDSEVDALRRLRDVDLDVAQARLQVKQSALAVRTAEIELRNARRSGDPQRIRQAELNLKQARLDNTRATRGVRDAEQDANRTRREAARTSNTAVDRQRSYIAGLRRERDHLIHVARHTFLTAGQRRRLAELTGRISRAEDRLARNLDRGNRALGRSSGASRSYAGRIATALSRTRGFTGVLGTLASRFLSSDRRAHRASGTLGAVARALGLGGKQGKITGGILGTVSRVLLGVHNRGKGANSILGHLAKGLGLNIKQGKGAGGVFSQIAKNLAGAAKQGKTTSGIFGTIAKAVTTAGRNAGSSSNLVSRLARALQGVRSKVVRAHARVSGRADVRALDRQIAALHGRTVHVNVVARKRNETGGVFATRFFGRSIGSRIAFALGADVDPAGPPKIGGAMAPHLALRPMHAVYGEEAPAHPEFFIPTNPRYRNRAIDFLRMAGETLGISVGDRVEAAAGLSIDGGPTAGAARHPRRGHPQKKKLPWAPTRLRHPRHRKFTGPIHNATPGPGVADRKRLALIETAIVDAGVTADKKDDISAMRRKLVWLQTRERAILDRIQLINAMRDSGYALYLNPRYAQRAPDGTWEDKYRDKDLGAYFAFLNKKGGNRKLKRSEKLQLRAEEVTLLDERKQLRETFYETARAMRALGYPAVPGVDLGQEGDWLTEAEQTKRDELERDLALARLLTPESTADDVTAATGLRDFWLGVVKRLQGIPAPAAVITQYAEQARGAIETLEDLTGGGEVGGGAAPSAEEALAQFQRFEEGRRNVFAAFGRNYVRPGGIVTDDSALAAGARYYGAFGAPAGGKAVQGPTAVTVTNHYLKQPDNPHAWSKGLAWELRAAM